MASAHAEENFKLYMLRKGPRQKIQSVLDAVTSMQQARRAREEGE
jgi:hypothetical protein